MTTLTEARKAALTLQNFSAGLPPSLHFIQTSVIAIIDHLDGQVSESQEVGELRARLARAEGFVSSVIEISRRHGNKEQYVVDVNKLDDSPYTRGEVVRVEESNPELFAFSKGIGSYMGVNPPGLRVDPTV